MASKLTAFVDAPYVLGFVGTSNGVVQCATFNELHGVLQNTYPNPGDPTLAFLLNPANWQQAADGMPFFTEVLVDHSDADGYEDYRVAIYRVMELES